MSIYLIRRGDTDIEKGVWWSGTDATLSGMVLVSCPKCGKRATLNTRGVHRVHADGIVTPSWVCPYPPCDFHEWCKLEEWTRGEG